MLTHNVKVGLAVVAAVVIVLITMRFVGGEKFTEDNTYTLKVVFENVQGLSPGAKVWLSGVEVGKVEEVVLRDDGRAVLNLRIGEKYQIRRDAEFNIKVGFLKDTILSITNPDVRPVKLEYFKSGDTITKTRTPSTLDDLVGEAHKALKQVNDMLASVKQIVGDDTMKQNVHETVENVRMITEQIYDFATVLKQVGVQNQAEIDSIIANINVLTANLIKTSEKADMLLANVNDVAGDPEVKQDLKQAIDNLEATMANLEETTDSVKKLITDEELNQDLKQTIKSTRRTMENADTALAGVRRAVDTVNNTEVKPSYQLRYNTRENKYHADMNLRMYPPDPSVNYLIGLDDLGENSNTTLQLGVRGALPGMWYRLGIKSGKLGMGADYEKDDIYMEGDLLDPNDLEFNLRVGKELQPNRYLLMGWEEAFKNDGLSIGFMQKY